MKRTEPAAGRGQVRIIAGRMRGSRLDVPDVPGLRPTADRVRETLFNWLAPHLPGACCLDLFAGSGALGFEAASRGAAEVVMIERETRVAAALRATAARLGASAVRIVGENAMVWLARPAEPKFDLVFVDPPFASDLLETALAALPPWLATDALVYVESAQDRLPTVPAEWRVHREGRTRDVRYALHRAPSNAPATLSPDSQAQDLA
jgi:16S rRNA (guanine966-N2)-methyltransferase